MFKKRENRIIAALLIIIIALLTFTCSTLSKKPTKSGVLINTKTEKFESHYVTLNGFSEINFKSGETIQDFNFVNPAKNRCYMNIRLVTPDSKTLFEVKRIEPGYSISEVQLNRTLNVGEYSGCKFVIDCFSIQDGAQLNGATMNIILYVR